MGCRWISFNALSRDAYFIQATQTHRGESVILIGNKINSLEELMACTTLQDSCGVMNTLKTRYSAVLYSHL